MTDSFWKNGNWGQIKIYLKRGINQSQVSRKSTVSTGVNMHKSRLSNIIIDCQVEDIDAAAHFLSACYRPNSRIRR